MSSPIKIERTVTFGLVATLLLQTAGGLIWVGSTEARMAELESEVDSSWGIKERLARIEGETAIMIQSLQRIEQAVHDE